MRSRNGAAHGAEPGDRAVSGMDARYGPTLADSGDIVEPTWSSIVSQIDATVPLAAYARPGAFNDPDMLEIGNGALTPGEHRVHFSVWSILSAPLFAGNDLTTMTDETLAILTNSRRHRAESGSARSAGGADQTRG